MNSKCEVIFECCNMKIPETSANIGAYYGNEENGQWQPNGVMMDTGVGGGVVGSGDAGVHRPPVYPVPHAPPHHVPGTYHVTYTGVGGGVVGSGDAGVHRLPVYPVPHAPPHHVPGYVMAGAYYPAGYPAPAPPDDFADYMWMENEEEFDKQVMQQLEEEALMEQCIEAMLEDEHRERRRPSHKHYATTSNGTSLSLEETVSRSKLNPLAAEFVPTTTRTAPAPPSEDKTDSPNTTTEPLQESTVVTVAPEKDKAREASPSATETQDTTDESKIEEPRAESPAPAPVEVSATSALHDAKKDPKRTPKQDTRKPKPQSTKSDTKIQPKKKEAKAVKSEVKLDEKTEDAPPETGKPQPSQAEEPAPSGPKPINYAAAARANKPKKLTHPAPVLPSNPAPEKPQPNKTEKPAAKPKETITSKPKAEKTRSEKPVQRKNSTK